MVEPARCEEHGPESVIHGADALIPAITLRVAPPRRAVVHLLRRATATAKPALQERRRDDWSRNRAGSGRFGRPGNGIVPVGPNAGPMMFCRRRRVRVRPPVPAPTLRPRIRACRVL